MNCCVCWGSCSHIGPHSYCAAHGGSPYAPTVDTTATSPVWANPPWFTPPVSHCDHCFCEEEADPWPDHARCCKCKTRMHHRFLAPSPESLP